MPSRACSTEIHGERTSYITACPLGCALPLIPTSIVLAEGALRQCRECGQLVSQATPARYEETMTAFDALDFNLPTGRELARRRSVAERRLHKISALLGRPLRETRLVDVGCSRGQFVRAALKLGADAEGVEPASRMAAAARETGLRVHTGFLEDVRFPAESFDAVTLFEVVEHLAEPLSLMRECRRILKPGGIACLSTGNARSWTVSAMGARWDYFNMEKDGGHVSFFNPESIAVLARRTGFAVAEIDTARVRFTEKDVTPSALHAIAKPLAELLSFPARLAGRGHDMVAYLRAQ